MIINLCPHEIVLLDGEKRLVFATSGRVARCEETTKFLFYVENDMIPIVRKTYGEVENLPDEDVGVYYIVSAMVRLACPHRKDLLSPGDPVRDENGKIIAVKNLVKN